MTDFTKGVRLELEEKDKNRSRKERGREEGRWNGQIDLGSLESKSVSGGNSGGERSHGAVLNHYSIK